MTRVRLITMTAAVGLGLTLAGCGQGISANNDPSFSWFPSTPRGTPGSGQVVSKTPIAKPSAAPAVGQGQAKGLGTPASSISAGDDLKFTPATSTAKSGDVLQWTTTGTQAHNVTFDGQPDITSPTLNKGDTWQVKFTVAGKYTYHCTFHAGMDGTVTVGG
jgi:plastocyanin